MTIAAGCLLRRVRMSPGSPTVEVLGWVEEGRQQRERVVRLGPVGRVRAGDVVVEHRVPEPVDGVGELGLDRRVDVRGVDVERVDRRDHLAGELLEDEVLVLHLGHEPGGLEEAVAVAPHPGVAPAPSTRAVDW